MLVCTFGHNVYSRTLILVRDIIREINTRINKKEAYRQTDTIVKLSLFALRSSLLESRNSLLYDYNNICTFFILLGLYYVRRANVTCKHSFVSLGVHLTLGQAFCLFTTRLNKTTWWDSLTQQIFMSSFTVQK